MTTLTIRGASLAACFLAATAAGSHSAELGGSNLEAALDSVSLDNIRSDIFFIASDELRGRDTPSAGQRIAARYIRARLERLGWEPGFQGSYLYPYYLQNAQLDGDRSESWLQRGDKRVPLEFLRDVYFTYVAGPEQLVEGGVAFAGDGKADSFEGLDLTGKWALCHDVRTSSRKRERAAAEVGAIGVIVTPGPDYEDRSYADRFGNYARQALRPSVRWPSDDGPTEPDFPTLYLDTSGASSLYALAGVDPTAVKPGQDLGVVFGDRRVPAGEGGRIELENVVGFMRGNDPELADEVIIISAHYDHVGERENGDIYNGADDNGSGTTGLLALAEALKAGGPWPRSILLIWVSGEEKGLLGSRAWTENPWLPEGCRPILDLNIDMIGRNAPDKLLITPTSKMKQYNGLVRVAERAAPLEGFPELGSADDYWSRSDHANFSRNLGIPVAFLFSDVHEDYHRPTDTPDKIDVDKIRRVVRLVVRMVAGLQEPELDL
jgi:hypothetical protein